MKKIIVFAALLLSFICASAQDGKHIYMKYSDEPNVSAVYVSPAMFRLIGRIPEHNLPAFPLLLNITSGSDLLLFSTVTRQVLVS